MKINLRLKGKRILLLIDGKKEGIFPKSLLKGLKDSDINEIELKKLFDEIIIPYAKEIVLRNLNIRDRTEKEILDILKKREFSEETSKKIVEDFKNVNLIDDIKTAKLIVQNSQGKSRLELKYKLKNMGIKNEEIEDILKDYNEKEVLKREIIKYRRKYKDIHKLKRYLLSRGFDYEIVSDLLDGIKMED